MSLERLILLVANIIGFVLMLAFWLSPAKLAGKADVVYIYCGVVFLVDVFCVVLPALFTEHFHRE